jgi:AcrR family transcriptional regulator
MVDALGKGAWLDAALVALAEGGVEAVKVEPLARALGVTKGSFYWHFTDRRALLDAVLEAWEQRATIDVMRAVSAPALTPSARLHALIAMTFGRASARERAMRAWAMHDDAARSVLVRVDTQRLEFVVDLFVAHGLSRKAARARARMLYASLLGEPDIAVRVSQKERVDQALHVLDALLEVPSKM